MQLKDIIIHEDNNLIAVNKPYGLVVNRADSVRGENLYDLVKDYLKIPLEIPEGREDPDDEDFAEFYKKSGVLHRLDKSTSGILIIAKTPESYRRLKRLFVNRKIKKTYFAICFNDLSKYLKTNVYIKVSLPLIRDVTNRQKFGVSKEGKESSSKVYAGSKNYISTFKDYTFSFVKVIPKSGRTHQIRVHMKALNCEILGDSLYGGRMQARFAKLNNFKMMLVSKRLSFKCFGQNYKFEIPYPLYFDEALKLIFKAK